MQSRNPLNDQTDMHGGVSNIVPLVEKLKQKTGMKV